MSIYHMDISNIDISNINMSKIDENQWKSMRIDENRWNLMKTNEIQWKWIKNYCFFIIFTSFLMVSSRFKRKNWSEFVPGPDFSTPPAQKLIPGVPGSPCNGDPWGPLGTPKNKWLNADHGGSIENGCSWNFVEEELWESQRNVSLFCSLKRYA